MVLSHAQGAYRVIGGGGMIPDMGTQCIVRVQRWAGEGLGRPTVAKIDLERGLVMVKGAVPGAKGGWVLLRDAVKRPMPADVPLPAGLVADMAPVQEEAPVEEVAAEEVVETVAEEAVVDAPVEEATSEEKDAE